MLKTYLKKAMGIISICLLVLAVAILPAVPTQARYAGKADCDNNAIIHCGINSEAELKQKYRSDAFVRTVYKHFSVPNEAGLSGMVKGRVTKTNEVWVGNERLATGAVTTGRVKMGSDEVKVPGANAWMRPPSRSFRSDSLEALVKLNSRGEFMHAVIMSCGNPVQAAHKVQKPAPQKPAPQKPAPQKPAPTPEKPKPTPQIPKKPKMEISKDVQVLTSEGWSFEWMSDEVEAKPGDQARFRITVKNTGDADLKDVLLQDSLPEGFTYNENEVLQGSDVINDKTVADLIGDGIQIESIAPGESVEAIFRVTLEGLEDSCDKLRNIATASTDNMPDARDDAEVKVCQSDKEAPAPTEEEETPPQVKGEQTPSVLPSTGVAGAVGVFSVTSFLGFAAYKLKEFYLLFLK